MIGLVLAAGRGSRLGSYTDDRPKSLLPLNDSGDTLLDYNLRILQDIGVKKTFVVTGYMSAAIEANAEKYSNTQIVYNPFWNHCNVLGSMYMSMDKLDDDFLFLHADTLMEVDAWKELVAQTDGDMILPYEAKECGEEEMKVIIKDGRVTKISKEFEGSLAAGEFVGIALFKKPTIPYFKDTAEALFKLGDLNHYMESVIQKSIDERAHDIRPLDISQYDFVEVDFEEDYERAKKAFGSAK
jgi:choline kinase